jgi:hypothetical protein
MLAALSRFHLPSSMREYEKARPRMGTGLGIRALFDDYAADFFAGRYS